MVAVDPVSLRDIPQDFAKLYIQHELLSSRARQQGMSYIIENYIHDVRIEKSYAKADKRRWSLMVGRCYRTTVANENLKNPTLTWFLASNKAATNKVNFIGRCLIARQDSGIRPKYVRIRPNVCVQAKYHTNTHKRYCRCRPIVVNSFALQ